MRSDRVPSDAHFRGRDLLIPVRLSCRLVTSQGYLPCSCERAGEACVCLTAFSWELLGCRESISDAIRRRPLPPLHQLDRHDCLRDATYATCPLATGAEAVSRWLLRRLSGRRSVALRIRKPFFPRLQPACCICNFCFISLAASQPITCVLAAARGDQMGASLGRERPRP